MKKGMKLAAALLLSICSQTMLSAAIDGDLAIEVKNLRNNNGRVLVALTESPMPTDLKFVRADMAVSNANGVKFLLKEIPEGTYYIQLFHDENGNMRMDMTPEGKPAEGFGRYPHDPANAPKVEIGSEDQSVQVKLLYF